MGENLPLNDVFLRGLTEKHLAEDPKANGNKRVSTAFARPSTGEGEGMSGWSKERIKNLQPVPSPLDAKHFIGIVKWDVSTIVKVGNPPLSVKYDPKVDDQAHCQVYGTGRFPRSVQKELLRQADWEKAANGIDLL